MYGDFALKRGISVDAEPASSDLRLLPQETNTTRKWFGGFDS